MHLQRTHKCAAATGPGRHTCCACARVVHGSSPTKAVAADTPSALRCCAAPFTVATSHYSCRKSAAQTMRTSAAPAAPPARRPAQRRSPAACARGLWQVCLVEPPAAHMVGARAEVTQHQGREGGVVRLPTHAALVGVGRKLRPVELGVRWVGRAWRNRASLRGWRCCCFACSRCCAAACRPASPEPLPQRPCYRWLQVLHELCEHVSHIDGLRGGLQRVANCTGVGVASGCSREQGSRYQRTELNPLCTQSVEVTF
jgi:hypothetical protein